MAEYMVTAVGADRPGIVAAVTTPLAALGCNLADCSSTILRGHFAMMVVITAPAGHDATTLAAAIGGHADPLGVAVTVAPVAEAAAAPQATHALSVYGADRPGIVRDIAQFLSDRHIDITDLQSRLIGRQTPVYVALLELAIPSDAAAEALQGAVRELATQFGVEISLRALETDAL
jgi:glycine cleavage system transcriptional repressor